MSSIFAEQMQINILKTRGSEPNLGIFIFLLFWNNFAFVAGLPVSLSV